MFGTRKRRERAAPRSLSSRWHGEGEQEKEDVLIRGGGGKIPASRGIEFSGRKKGGENDENSISGGPE